ncbi:MAG: L-threonylcarbamoyladenylate synthase [Clostridia bacterium]
MRLYDFKKGIINSKLNEVAKAIKEGKIAVFPTETVYGIGANAYDENAVNSIFKAKGRPSDNPLIVHICDIEMLNKVTKGVSRIEKLIIDKFWPGPLTIILQKSDKIPLNVTCGLDTVGIRMPDEKIALELIKKAGIPIAAPSANISGRPSGTNIADIVDELKDKVDYIIDGGNTNIGVESTVIKVVANQVNILRPGIISPEDFEKIGIKVKLDTHIFEDVKQGDKIESPGMKHRHYAPKTNTFLVDCYKENTKEDAKGKKMIAKILKIASGTEDIICVIGCSENKKALEKISNIHYIDYGSKYNLLEISKNIFTSLRQVDKKKVNRCYIEGVKKEGIGIAIMNRLIRACDYNIV